MAMSDHVTRVAKLRGRITSIDPAQRIIEVATVDGNARRLFVSDIPNGFVWPVVNETWSIYEENGLWVLGNKFLNPDEAAVLESLQPGEKYPPDAIRIGINQTVTGGSSTITISGLTGQVDNTYAVMATPHWNTTTWVTNKAIGGFVIHFGTVPGSASSVDWILYR